MKNSAQNKRQENICNFCYHVSKFHVLGFFFNLRKQVLLALTPKYKEKSLCSMVSDSYTYPLTTAAPALPPCC